MTENQKEIVYQAVGAATMCWEPIPSGTFDSSRCQEEAKPIEELVDGLNAEVERLDKDVKTLTAERERLNKALEQALRYEEWVYSDEKRCPELAAWLKENR